MEKEIDFLNTVQTFILNNIPKQDLIELIEDRKETLKEKLSLLPSSLLLKDNYKIGFDEWKIRNGYKKDINHKCYFKGNKAYFDFDLIEEYNNTLK